MQLIQISHLFMTIKSFRKRCIFSLIIGVFCINSLYAAATTWTGSGDGVSWTDAANWSGNAPSFNDHAIIDTDGASVNVSGTGNVTGGPSASSPLTEIGAIDLGGGGATLNIAGDLETRWSVQVGGRANGNSGVLGTVNHTSGTFTITNASRVLRIGGTVNAITTGDGAGIYNFGNAVSSSAPIFNKTNSGSVNVGRNGNETGTLNMFGYGTFSSYDLIHFSDGAGSGTWNITGGNQTINIGYGLTNTDTGAILGEGAIGTFNLGATIDATGLSAINVTGNVELGDATTNRASLSLTHTGFTPVIGTIYTLINGTGSLTGAGVFNNVADGGIISSGSYDFRVNYDTAAGDVKITSLGINTGFTNVEDVSTWDNLGVSSATNMSDNSAGYSGVMDANNTLGSLRFNTANASTIDLGTNTLTIDSGSTIRVNSAVGSNATTISNGTLRGSASDFLRVAQENTAANFTISAVIADNTGASGLIKIGDGTLILSGANTYTGETQVLQGTLQLSGAGSINSASGLVVSNGATLNLNSISNQFSSIAGGGTVQMGGNNNLQLGSAATIDLGDSGEIGTLNIAGGDFTWNSAVTDTSSLVWQLGNAAAAGAAGAAYDSISFTGALDFTGLSAGDIEIIVQSKGSTSIGWGEGPGYVAEDTNGYKILEAASITGFDPSFFTFNTTQWTDGGGWWYDWKIYQNGNALYLAYSGVPEPSTYFTLSFLFIAIALRWKMKKSNKEN